MEDKQEQYIHHDDYIEPQQSTRQQIDEYERLIGYSQAQFNFQHIRKILLPFGVTFNPQQFKDTLQITVEECLNNFEVFYIKVKYGSFTTYLSIFNGGGQNQIKNVQRVFTGSFGSVYEWSFKGQCLAVKSIVYQQDNFQYLFLNIVQQYFINTIAGILGLGVKTVPAFGFDLLVLDNQIVFCMQFCQSVSSSMELFDIKKNLRLLHFLKIVHLDIKPQNIMIDPTGNPVLIDFGLSKVITQSITQKSLTYFVGSIQFCSKQMLDIYLQQKIGYVNFYLHDSICLTKTISYFDKLIKKGDLFDNDSSDEETYFSVKPNEHKFIDKIMAKYFLFATAFKLKTRQGYSLQYARKAAEDNIVNLKQYFNKFSSSFRLSLYFKKNLSIKIKQKIIPPFNFLQLQEWQSQTKTIQSHMLRDIFRKRSLLNQNQTCFWDEEKILTQSDKYRIYPEQYRRLTFIRLVKIGGKESSFSTKIQYCRLYLGLELQQIQENAQIIYKNAIIKVFNDSINSLMLPACQAALICCLETIIILQLLPEQMLYQVFFKCAHQNIQFIAKMRILFHFMAALEIIRQKFKRIYAYGDLSISFTNKIKDIINQRNPQNKDEIVIIKYLQCATSQEAQQVEQKLGIAQSYNIQEMSISLKHFIEQITIYTKCQQLLRLVEYNFNLYENKYLELFYCLDLSGQSSICNLFALFRISYQFGNTNCVKILFKRIQNILNNFKEFSHFRCHLQNTFNTIVIEVKNIKNKHTYQWRSNQLLFDQFISNIDYIIQHRVYFQQYIISLFNSNYMPNNQEYSKAIKRLILKHRQKIFKLQPNLNCNQYHQHLTHMKLVLINNILTFIYSLRIDPSQKWDDFLEKSIEQMNIDVQTMKCFNCKAFCLVQILLIKSKYLTLIQRNQQSLTLLLGVFQICIQNRDLTKLVYKVFIENFINVIKSQRMSIKYDYYPIFYDYLLATENYDESLYQTSQMSLWIGCYFFIHYRCDASQMLYFLSKIAEIIEKKRSDYLALRFYQNIVELNRIRHYQSFKQYEDYTHTIINSLMKIPKLSNYISIYFFGLLYTVQNQEIASKMIQFIAKRIDQSSQIIKAFYLSQYYNYFIGYFSLSRRKFLIISKKHGKNSIQLFQKNQVVSGLLGYMNKNKYRKNKFILNLKKHTKKYFLS